MEQAMNPYHDASRWRRLGEAAAFAVAIHAGQARKGSGTPYIGHLFGVAGLVLEHGGDEDQAIAGLLHDAIEDTGAAQEAVITERFGARVAAIVRACTDADVVPKPPWRARKEAYLLHLPEAGADALLVSACDKLHNARAICTDLRALGPEMFGRFTGGRKGTLWYYRALADVFGRVMPGVLAAEVAEVVGEMERLAVSTAASDEPG